MSFSNDFLSEGDRATYLDMLPFNHAQTTESAYPDPTSLVTQPLLYHEGPLLGTFNPYLQPGIADVIDLQGQEYLLPDFMQYPEPTSRTFGQMPAYCSPYQTQLMSPTLEQIPAFHSPNQTQLMLPRSEQMADYHSPYQTQPMSQASGRMPNYCSPYESQTLLQTQEQMAACHGPYQTQLMSPTLEQMPDYRSQYQTDPPVTDRGINDQLPSPMSLSPEDSTPLQGDRSHQKRRKTKSPSTDNEVAPSGNRTRRKRKPTTLSGLAPSQSLQQPNLGTRSRATRAQKVSKMGQLKARLGERMGSDYRERETVRWKNETMLGWVDNEWKPAVYHAEIREKLILLDAQQPGAPVWENGMSLNYTSYSPITRGWTSDPASIRDMKGRQVCLMRRPPDWTHNPKTGFLTHEGLFILDENNRPIKDFPGAPLAISNKVPAYLLEGLRRTFGMTISDARARMPIRNTRFGPKPLQSIATFTNRVMLWKKKVNSGGRKIMFVWHDRTKKRATKETANTSSGPQDEEVEEADSISDSVPTSSMDMNETSRSPDDHLHPSMQETSAAMTAPNGFIQHQTWHFNPLLSEAGLDQFSEAAGIPEGSYFCISGA